MYGWDSLMTCWLLWFTNYIAIPHANLHGSICYLESTKSTTIVTTKVSPFTTYTTLHPISLCPTATMFSHIDPLNAILQSCDLPCYGKIVAVLLQCDWTYFWWVWWYDMTWSEYTKKDKYRRTQTCGKEYSILHPHHHELIHTPANRPHSVSSVCFLHPANNKSAHFPVLLSVPVSWMHSCSHIWNHMLAGARVTEAFTCSIGMSKMRKLSLNVLH
jgi:hypothetical protein